MESIKKFRFRNWLTMTFTLTLALVAFFAMSTSVFAADGDLTSMTLEDTNANGEIETVTLVIEYANAGNGGAVCTQITHATDLATSEGQFTVTDDGSSETVDLDTPGIEWVSGSAGVSCTIKLNLDEADTSLSVNTSATAVDVEYNATGNELRVADAVPTPANVAAILTGATEVDGAAPQIKSLTYQDNDADGMIDQFLLTYSEEVTAGSVISQENLDLTDVGDFTAAAFGTTGVDLIDGATTTTTAVLDTESTAVDTNEGLGSIAVTSQDGVADFSLTDGTNENTTPKAETHVTFIDGAAPAILTGTYGDADDDGVVDEIVLTTSIDTSMDCTNYDQNDITVTTVGGFTLATAAGDGCSSNGTSTYTIALDGAMDADETGGESPIITYTTSVDSLRDGADNEVPTKAGLTLSDNAKPILLSVTAGATSGVNTLAFVYSETMAISGCSGAASSSTCGDLTTAGQFKGLGTFGTGGNLIADATAKNTVALSTTTLTDDTVTVSLAAESGGYLETGDVAAITVPSGTVTGHAAGGIVDANTNQVNESTTAVAASALPGDEWDVTPPTISTAVLSDADTNGTADTIVLTSNETLKTITTGGGTIDDWANTTGAENEYGTSLTIATAAAAATTYTITFTGANIFYDPGTFEVINTQDTVPSFVDRAGNPLSSGLTAQTYKVCYTGYSCAGGDIANSAILTNSITQPGQPGGGADTTPPAVPTSLSASVNDNLQVVLTWTDPITSDFSGVRIYRIKNDEGAISINIAGGGTETYTDSAVTTGDVVKYAIASFDLTGNESNKTSYVELTVEIGEVGEEVVVTEEEEELDEVEEVVPGEEVPGEEVPGEEVPGEEVPGEEAPSFTDTSDHWAEVEVEAMAEEEIVQGDPDGSFRPDGNLNRAEAAALLYRVLGLEEPSEPSSAPFPDVAVDAWYAGYVSELLALELVSGNPDGTYEPGESINRAEFLTLAMNVYYYMTDEDTKAQIDALKAGETTTAYQDLEDAWYTPCVTAATELGFVSGSVCEGGMCFNAESEVTRAEATVILYNMFYAML